jgi:unsaturated chondroitin disaccharide hydrolase
MSWTKKLEQEKNNGKTHDIGFMIYCSFGNGYRLTGNNEYLNTILDASKTLSGRFDPKTGCIRSWDWGKWKYPVIVDNMMNLEMLFFAAQKASNPHLKEIAVSHAQKTLENQFRKNYSCWHVVDYDPDNGNIIGKSTHQGYNDESTWTRGVAWSIYGFALSYRETGDTAFLSQANKIVDFIKNHPRMPEDNIPWWDMDCPGIPGTYKDASSASIMAAALAELYILTKNKHYLSYCEMLVRNLATQRYMLKSNEKYGFILDHSVGNIHKNWEVDKPLNYADYYFVEALLKLKKIYEDA